MLHFDPQEIETESRSVRGHIHAAGGDGARDHRLAGAQLLFHRTLPVHFRISHISDTWFPRPFPPSAGSRFHVNNSSPLRVASLGISNSIGPTGAGFFIKGWISMDPFATRRICALGLSPAYTTRILYSAVRSRSE